VKISLSSFVLTQSPYNALKNTWNKTEAFIPGYILLQNTLNDQIQPQLNHYASQPIVKHGHLSATCITRLQQPVMFDVGGIGLGRTE
jgi:hypothetical protein